MRAYVHDDALNTDTAAPPILRQARSIRTGLACRSRYRQGLPRLKHTVCDGDDVTIISNGTVLWRALAAAEQLAEDGVSARVISMPTVKPLDVDAVLSAARETGGIVTAEEATSAGSLGGAVAETVVQRHPAKMRILGVPEFAPTGSAGYLVDRYGMSAEGIAEAARGLIR